MQSVLIQIALLDIVFSLDSVITAVGMADQVEIMIAAVVIAVGLMMFSARPVSAFVENHPTMKMLALSFLLLIGVSLIARKPRPAHPERLYLLRDGVLSTGRDAESSYAEKRAGRDGSDGRRPA